MKKTTFVISVCFIGMFLIALLVIFPTMIAGMGFSFSKKPLTPTQKTGEFPFRLVYTVDGEQYTEEGTFVCEYMGVSMNTAYGKFRKWRGYIKETEKTYLVLYKNEKVEVRCDLGNPIYYMNDINHPQYEHIDVPVKPSLHLSPSGGMPENVIKSQYKIELIDWTISEPIKNSFK